MSRRAGGRDRRGAARRPLGYRRFADLAGHAEERPLGVLLLPRRVEEMGRQVAELLAAPAVVAVEPARMSGRVPAVLADALAAVQARRLRLPGQPRAVVVFDPRQYRLARALLVLHPDAELWYGGEDEGPLHELALERAELRFSPSGDDDVLWERMDELGII
jgi:hypothetical protein